MCRLNEKIILPSIERNMESVVICKEYFFLFFLKELQGACINFSPVTIMTKYINIDAQEITDDRISKEKC